MEMELKLNEENLPTIEIEIEYFIGIQQNKYIR